MKNAACCGRSQQLVAGVGGEVIGCLRGTSSGSPACRGVASLVSSRNASSRPAPVISMSRAAGIAREQGADRGVGVGADEHRRSRRGVGPRHAGQRGAARRGRRRAASPGSSARRPCALISVAGPSATTRPAGHEHDPVGVGVGLLQVVGGEQDGLAPAANARIVGQNVRAALDVHADGRLVEHEQVGVADEREGEADPLGLPAGQLVACAARRASAMPASSSTSSTSSGAGSSEAIMPPARAP